MLKLPFLEHLTFRFAFHKSSMLSEKISSFRKLNQLLNRGDKEMSELRPLGNNITSEKVAELRKKRQNNLKRNIAQTADE